MTKETVTELSGFINKISEKIGKSLSDFTEKFITKINMVMATEYMRDFFAALQQCSLDIENNPDSYFNYMRYQKNLDNMHWAWPYEIKTEELKSLLENAHNEKEFDTLMKFFFKEEKIDKSLRNTDIITRVGPTLGLMGTLIPLGPGLAALGAGDVNTLADALTIAFDTTVVGIGSGALCYFISKIRRGWYDQYLSDLDALSDAVLFFMNKH